MIERANARKRKSESVRAREKKDGRESVKANRRTIKSISNASTCTSVYTRSLLLFRLERVQVARVSRLDYSYVYCILHLYKEEIFSMVNLFVATHWPSSQTWSFRS